MFIVHASITCIIRASAPLLLTHTLVYPLANPSPNVYIFYGRPQRVQTSRSCGNAERASGVETPAFEHNCPFGETAQSIFLSYMQLHNCKEVYKSYKIKSEENILIYSCSQEIKYCSLSAHKRHNLKNNKYTSSQR
jgi:hypothetical protein